MEEGKRFFESDIPTSCKPCIFTFSSDSACRIKYIVFLGDESSQSLSLPTWLDADDLSTVLVDVDREEVPNKDLALALIDDGLLEDVKEPHDGMVEYSRIQRVQILFK